MHNTESWFEGNFAKILFPKSNLSSQKISKILSTLGDESIQRKFLIILIRDERKKLVAL